MHEQTGSEDLRKEIEAFKDDIRRLKNDLDGLAGSATDLTKEKIMEYRDSLRHSMQHLSEKTQETYHGIEHRGEELLDKGRSEITRKPITAVLSAFAAGMLVTLFMKRK